MKSILISFFCSACGFFIAGCGSEDSSSTINTYRLNFQGSEFDPHNEQVLTAAIIDRSNGAVLVQENATVSNGSFSFEWTGLLEESKSYFLDYYVDMNGGLLD
ncbi:MAG: hypothetical protein HRU09_20480 [Oligoflexales bacterium]|nr:hypothetical protein [Oligoflexales bacterium]